MSSTLPLVLIPNSANPWSIAGTYSGIGINGFPPRASRLVYRPAVTKSFHVLGNLIQKGILKPTASSLPLFIPILRFKSDPATFSFHSIIWVRSLLFGPLSHSVQRDSPKRCVLLCAWTCCAPETASVEVSAPEKENLIVFDSADSLTSVRGAKALFYLVVFLLKAQNDSFP